MQREARSLSRKEKRAITVELDRGNFSVRITRKKSTFLVHARGGMQGESRLCTRSGRRRKWLKSWEARNLFPGRLINVPRGDRPLLP